MKIIKILLSVLLGLVLIAVTALFIFLQTFDLDRYFPQFDQKASVALGRRVSVGHAGIGLSWKGMTLDLGPVTVGDDPAFTRQPFVKIDRVSVAVDWKSLIYHREFRAVEIILRSPQIHFIVDEQGKINARSLGAFGNHFSHHAGPVPPVVPAKMGGGSRAVFKNDLQGLMQIPITIQDGAISFIDQNPRNYLDIWTTGVNGTLEPGHVLITGAVIKNFNIIKILLSRALGNFVGGHIDNLLNVPQLSMPDTFIDKAEVRFSLPPQAVSIDDFLIRTNILELRAHGLIDQELNTDMQTVVHINQDISAGLIDQFGGLKYLTDGSRCIALQASLTGRIPHLRYKLSKDFRKMERKALVEEGVNILGALLGGHKR
ncbi:MAG: AsmA family protein [Candidatus Omnitrophica bacterium]|nr:AsmA family protein [Candidatus Omnitrophota bacterium]MDE2222449.1 AsmA family protein [Candidatus Omnitrophota bacterium]